MYPVPGSAIPASKWQNAIQLLRINSLSCKHPADTKHPGTLKTRSLTETRNSGEPA